MDISMFEDQTGFKIYPDAKSDRDNRIVSFFNNNIDLYIEKLGTNLTIYCHLIAYRASSRPIGYYIVYKDDYKENLFTNLKKIVDKVMNDLNLRLNLNHKDNLIFENIEKFDDPSNREDINAIMHSIKRGKNLGYSGDIRSISSFSNNILRNIQNIKISISSIENELGDVNFLLNKKNGDSLKKSVKTEMAISESKRIMFEDKRSEMAVPGRVKITEGINKIKEGTDILKNAGYSEPEIITEIDKKMCEIYNRKKIDIGNKSRESIIDKQIIDKEEEVSGHHTTAIVLLIFVVAFAIIYVMPPIGFEKFKPIMDRIIPSESQSPSPSMVTPTILSNITSNETVSSPTAVFPSGNINATNGTNISTTIGNINTTNATNNSTYISNATNNSTLGNGSNVTNSSTPRASNNSNAKK